MILIAILLIALIITAAAIIVPSIFHYKSKLLQSIVCFGICICIISGFICGIVASQAKDVGNWLKTESANIQLYYNTIAHSDNEYVRYDFYNRVTKYNRVYKSYQNKVENSLISWLYDGDVLIECAPIEFALNTGTYG